MTEKIVDFHEWCNKCVYDDKPENEEPCWECLTKPVNEDSHRPINYKEKVDANKRT